MSAPSPDSARLCLLYDGECRFCTDGTARLARLARPGSLELVNLKDPAQIARFPQITPAAADRGLQLVEPSGRVHSGAAAVVAALNTRPIWRLFTWPYAIPGIRHLNDALYALVARNRYRIAGRVSTCDSGACKTPE